MTVFRAGVAIAAAIAAILAFSPVLRADDAPPTAMPQRPEPGKPTTAAPPPLGDISGAGKAIGGLPPARLLKTLKGARASIDPALRGQHEQDLYAKFSRSVVMIVTPDILGSGAVVDKDGTIVTNWHVVGTNKTVGVIFKPHDADARVRESDAVEAKVLRVDQIADLAILKVASIPGDVRIIALGDPSKLSIGADVHAIGHPFGETWSYTKGVVSQIRHAYQWRYEGEGFDHHADVVQTQTPINPGNSGGPLLNDTGELVGISTFGSDEGALINFAIASNEVRRFLSEHGNRLAPAPAKLAETPKPSGKKCQPVVLQVVRTEREDGTIFDMDTDCNGKSDALLSVPDDKKKHILLIVDSNENGKTDVIYVDKNADLKFDEALYDIDEDGKVDLIGYDLNDNLEPGRIEAVRT